MQLKAREKVSYGVGAIGKDMTYALVSGFLLYYYNTILGVSATFVGIIFMAARIFDAFNDPLMGIIVEKTRSRFGKFRPWIFSGTILNAFVLYAMFAVPENLGGGSLKVYIAIAYVLWGVTYTIMDIPFWSMIPAITEGGKDRENLAVVARSCAGVGNALVTISTMILVPILGANSERIGFKYFAGIIAVLFICASIITVINVKEHVKVDTKPATVKEMFSSLFQNDQALIVVIAIIIFNSSLYLTTSLAIYFFKYDIGNEQLYSVFGAVAGAAQILAMMFFPAIRAKFSRLKIFVGAICTSLVGYAMLFLMGSIGIRNIIILCIPCAILFSGFGLVTILTTIFLADTVDYGEWKNGKRNESVVFSMQTFVVKLASAISVLIVGVGLDIVKLDINATTQAKGTILGMRFMMTIIPMAGLIVAMIFFKKKYKLTDKYLEKISTEIKERRGTND